ncbi:MAG: hypothetical protein V9F04_05260 [Dermatophilaceae bacterium]
MSVVPVNDNALPMHTGVTALAAAVGVGFKLTVTVLLVAVWLARSVMVTV